MGIKQVIVIRKDLNMRKGKIASQAAHASMGAILPFMKWVSRPSSSLHSDVWMKHDNIPEIFSVVVGYLCEWLNGKFTKICVSCDSEKELLDLYEKTSEKNIIACIIKDEGLTEFNNVPTKTAIAIGPWDSEEIDKITGHLKLL